MARGEGSSLVSGVGLPAWGGQTSDITGSLWVSFSRCMMIGNDKVYQDPFHSPVLRACSPCWYLGVNVEAGEAARRRPGPTGESLDVEALPSSPSSDALELEVWEEGVGRGARLRPDSSISQETQENICCGQGR